MANFLVILAAEVAVSISGSPKDSHIYLTREQIAEAVQKEFPVDERDRGIVNDAIKRLGEFEGAHRLMEGRVPIVFYTPSARCVKIHLLSPNIGGEPVYCYRKNKDILIEKDENVD